jgi:predicted nucleotide-binding protein (sugar kinase/HSP70/actin superfamily)
MCPIGARMMAGVFRSVGYNASVLEENDETLAIGYKHTSGGECVPCPSTTGALIHHMETHQLKPEDVIFFMPTACGPCRFGQYAKLDEFIFEKKDWQKIQILSPSAENAYAGLPLDARKRLFHAIIIGDIIRKIGMKVRPYEVEKGSTDALLSTWTQRFEDAFGKANHNAGDLLAQMVKEVQTIAVTNEKKPLVGIVGEIYVRSDPFINMNLYRRIEELGGEAWLAPISEWILYTSECSRLVAKESKEGVLKRIGQWMENHWFLSVENKYYKIADPILHDRHEPHIPEIMEVGERFLPWQFEGESILTLGRAVLFKEKNGASAIVNASPMFCMPGTVTTSIFPQLEQELGIPVLCNFYDGSGDPNQNLVPCMHYLCEEAKVSQA